MSMDSQIASIARDYLDDILRSLAPEAAPTPFMVSGGPHGVRHIELHSLTDPDFAKTAKTVIPAFIILNEGVEVVMSAFVTDPDICDGTPECALIAYWGPRARELFAAAVTRRKGQPPSSRRMAEGTCVGQPRPDRRRSAQRPGQGFTVPVP